MQIMLIILIALVALPDFQSVVQGSVIEVAILVWGTTSALILSALMVFTLQHRRLEMTNDPGIISQVELLARLMRWSAVVLVVIAVMVFGWGARVREVTGDMLILDEAILLAPAFVILFASWWLIYPFELRVHDARLIRDIDEGFPVTPLPNRLAWVILQVRTHLLLLLVPIAMIAVSVDVGRRAVGFLVVDAADWVRTLGGFFAAFPMILLSPWVTLRLLDTSPLPSGEVRDALEATCRSAGARIRDVMLWRTGGTMFNGAVTGFIPRARWVLLSDGLLERLEREEVLAVMGHELAHVRKRHMFWLAARVAAAGVILIMAIDPLVLELRQRVIDAGGTFESMTRKVEWIDLGATALVLACSLVIFGWVSRRFERQADAFAAVQLSGQGTPAGKLVAPEGVEAMRSALGSVSRLNGVPTSRHSWRHGSILGRQKALSRLEGTRCLQMPIDRFVRGINMASALTIGLGILFWSRTLLSGGAS